MNYICKSIQFIYRSNYIIIKLLKYEYYYLIFRKVNLETIKSLVDPLTKSIIMTMLKSNKTGFFNKDETLPNIDFVAFIGTLYQITNIK